MEPIRAGCWRCGAIGCFTAATQQGNRQPSGDQADAVLELTALVCPTPLPGEFGSQDRRVDHGAASERMKVSCDRRAGPKSLEPGRALVLCRRCTLPKARSIQEVP